MCFGNCATFFILPATNEGNFPSLRAAYTARFAIVHSGVSSTSGDRNQKIPRCHRHEDACLSRATDRTRVEVVPSCARQRRILHRGHGRDQAIHREEPRSGVRRMPFLREAPDSLLSSERAAVFLPLFVASETSR